MTTTSTPPPPSGEHAATDPLTTTDHQAFAFLGQVNNCLRQCLCTLARHGVALRQRAPARARLLLDTVRPWPLYKGGQFLFDLMEWEDLMVDGDPPPLMPTERIISASFLPMQLLAATAEAPTATKLILGQRTAAALDLPLRLLASTARTAFLCAAQDLTDLLGTPTPQAKTDDDTGHTTAAESDAEHTAAELPPLESGFYLYEDIVLGTLAVLGPLLADHAPTDTAPPA
ncbi:hypothetical protein [Streptomyces sp. NL15-2K]|uniref:hypothetical protein n=1 Tax=Streptomyces sp. NL15-2K TaxID=376149 RepID=UPI000F568BA9|nr:MULTISPECIES: hypothetical protein [Actinomycetes]WKX05994.1 hypothetical protein Q4V64_00185 [Kutzneria buriramensis]GCB53162.1 hypothetical protein SNL152K_10519 [Streptomyces sp. NL15-2K]